MKNQTTLLKAQLATIMGISTRSLSNQLNKIYYADLVKLGYMKDSKTLNIQVIQYFEPDFNWNTSSKYLQDLNKKSELNQNDSTLCPAQGDHQHDPTVV